jgi:Domain of unknown function (DUF1814).
VFQEALVQSLTHLEAAQRRGLLHHFALIGGFAVAAWGVPRATHDFDFAIALGASDPRAAAEFLGGEYEAGDAEDPLQGVIHLSLGPAPASVPVQLVIFPPAFADLVFRHVESLPLMERIVPVVSWPVLILLKLYAGGPQDLVDAQQILRARQPHQSDLERLRGMAESAGLLKEWASLSHSSF